MLGRIVKLEKHADTNGKLIAIEKTGERFGFDIKRVYYIYGTKAGIVRGKHAHKALKQLLICVSGSCVIHLDNGLGESQEVPLSNPDEALVLESTIWREMYDFSKDCVLLVLASEEYTEDDYFRNYEDFIRYVNKK